MLDGFGCKDTKQTRDHQIISELLVTQGKVHRHLHQERLAKVTTNLRHPYP
jgi:hypothetical protein